MIATITSATLLGLTAQSVTVEVHYASTGLPGLTVVGASDSGCRELRDRVRAAVLSSRMIWPTGRITINIAPMPLRPTSTLDLPIALGVLAASGQLNPDQLHGRAAVGELGLDGSLRPILGLFPLSETLQAHRLIVPTCPEASTLHAVHDSTVQAQCLNDVVDNIANGHPVALLATGSGGGSGPPAITDHGHLHSRHLDDLPTGMGEVLEIAAAGGHHLLSFGSTGAAWTSIPSGVVCLLPDLTPEQAVETIRAHSAAGLLTSDSGLVTRPPLIRPNPAGSLVSTVGGAGAAMAPGAIALAHNGVLALDDLAEYPAALLDCLSQPLDETIIRVARAHASIIYPARFILVATANQCPCGGVQCGCSPAALTRYAQRVPNTIIDRFHLRLDTNNPPPLTNPTTNIADDWTASAARARVATARTKAKRRGVAANAWLTDTQLTAEAPLTSDAQDILDMAITNGRLDHRGARIVRAVALTIADLTDHEDHLTIDQITAAIALRSDPFAH